MKDLSKLTQIEQELLLRWFDNHMPMEMRRKLMAELPVAYNHLVGDNVVRAVIPKMNGGYVEIPNN